MDQIVTTYSILLFLIMLEAMALIIALNHFKVIRIFNEN